VRFREAPCTTPVDCRNRRSSEVERRQVPEAAAVAVEGGEAAAAAPPPAAAGAHRGVAIPTPRRLPLVDPHPLLAQAILGPSRRYRMGADLAASLDSQKAPGWR
jgi:hypothetical protein